MTAKDNTLTHIYRRFHLPIVVTFLLYGLPTLVLPVGRDQGLFMYIGKRLLAGEALYRDIWDVKSPLLYYTYAFLGQLFGFTALGIRVGDLLIVAVTTFLLYKIGSNILSKRVGLFASIIFIVTYYQHDYRVLGNSEALLMPFLLLTIYTALLTVGEKRTRYLVISGIALGGAIAIKSTALFVGFPVFLFIFAGRFDLVSSKLKRFRSPTFFCLGLLLVFIMYMSFLLISGTMGDWYELNAVYLPHYAALSHTSGYWLSTKLFIWYLSSLPLHYPFMMFGAIIAFVRLAPTLRNKSKMNLPLLLVVAVSLSGMLTVVLQGQYVTYHNLTFIPTLSLVAAYGLSLIYGAKNKLALAVTAAIVLGALLFVSQRLPARWSHLAQTVSGSLDSKTQAKQLSSKSYNLETALNVSHYLSNASRADDKILVWTFEPEIYFLTDLDHSSRFLFNTVFINNANVSHWKKELVQSITDDPPKFIVVGINDGRKDLTGISYSSLSELDKFPELKNIINSKYTTDTLLDGYLIKVRTAPRQ